MLTDTIAAISTPPGEGSIGIVRISGDQALNIIEKIFTPKYPKKINEVPSYTIHLGIIKDQDENVVDEVLVSVMKGPKSFTTEDVVEINCHGGFLSLKRTLEVVLASGARLAEPGEFTKRAFLNGRIDLSQAEAIIDIIRSKTDAGQNMALSQLSGTLSNKIDELRHNLLGVLASIEASIDFPEDDIEEITNNNILSTTSEVNKEIKELLKTADHGKIFREGVNTIIIGRPNVGKSSLLNALLKEKKAIVTDIPGTTRDIIEDYINVGGIPLKILDTAGIRETEDIVEKIGVERTREALDKADLVLLVLDVILGITEEDKKIIEIIKDKKFIILVNKVDVDEVINQQNEIEEFIKELPRIYISAKEEIGIRDLEEKIREMIVGGEVVTSSDLWITNVRHKNALQKAYNNLLEVMGSLENGMPPDFLSIDVRAAWENLGEITGDTMGEDLLDRIFTDFCIGK